MRSCHAGLQARGAWSRSRSGSSHSSRTWALVSARHQECIFLLALMISLDCNVPLIIIIFCFVSDNKKTESRTEIKREPMPGKPF